MFDQLPYEGQKLMPINTLSVLDWPGLLPQKFSGNRKHLRPQDQLSGYEGAPMPLLGRKHYTQQYSEVGEYKAQLRVFPQLSNKTTDLTYLETGGVKKLNFIPPQRKARPEKLHLYAKKTTHFEDLAKGLRSFANANQGTSNQYEVEKQLQSKTRVDGLPPMRNNIEVRSLGDKPYKYPDYQSDFFKQGGLIAGSTIQDTRQKVVSEKHLQNVRVQGKLTWKEREIMEEAREDKRQVDELDTWEENTLKEVKEANPNWKDPEKFFDNEDNVAGKNDPKKDNKKAAKKK